MTCQGTAKCRVVFVQVVGSNVPGRLLESAVNLGVSKQKMEKLPPITAVDGDTSVAGLFCSYAKFYSNVQNFDRNCKMINLTKSSDVIITK